MQIVLAEDVQTAAAAIETADAAFGLAPGTAARARKLRWLQAPQAAPPAGYYYPELVAHPLAVTNFREIFNDHISAHIMAFVLAFARGLHVYHSAAASPRMEEADGRSGRGASAGRDGADRRRGRDRRGDGALAVRLRHAVLAVDARRTDKPGHVTELHKPEALDELLPRADFVILTVPHTPATEGFFNRARFRRMQPTAFFINIGRGMTTKLDDLVAALRAGEIAGAALDVYEQEPLPAEHPLWGMPNVLLTPHMAGYGPHLNERRFQIIQDNCRAFAEGRPLRNVVDKAAGKVLIRPTHAPRQMMTGRIARGCYPHARTKAVSPRTRMLSCC